MGEVGLEGWDFSMVLEWHGEEGRGLDSGFRREDGNGKGEWNGEKVGGYNRRKVWLEAARPNVYCARGNGLSLKALLPLLTDHPAFDRLADGLAGGGSATTSVSSGGTALVLSALREALKRPMLVIAPRQDDARRLLDQLSLYLGSDDAALPLPEPDVLPFERMTVDASTNNRRLMAINALAYSPSDNPAIVVSSLAAALRKTVPPSTFQQTAVTLEAGQRVRLGELAEAWVNMGYRREHSVEIPGSFSIRGGIVDVFSPNSELPLRLDLFGDEIESLHLFDPLTQRSMRAVERARIVPAQESLPLHVDRDEVDRLASELDFGRCPEGVQERFQEDLADIFAGANWDEMDYYHGLVNQSSILDHLTDDAIVVFLQQSYVEQEAESLEEHVERMRRGRVDRGELPGNFPASTLGWEDFAGGLADRPVLDVTPWNTEGVGFEFRSAPSFYGRIERFTSEVKEELVGGKTVVLASRHARRLAEILADAEIGSVLVDDANSNLRPGRVVIVPGSLEHGWRLTLPEAEVLLLTDLEIFGTAKERRSRPRRQVKKSLFLSQLEPGTFVVHEDHGVARFSGTTSMEANGESREYLVLEYAESDKLYLPTDHLDRIYPYVGTSDRPPTLTRLSSSEWARAKERVKASARELARELLDLYANRRVAKGHAFSADVVWQQEMEDAFPYEETPDQARVIDEVKADMEDVQPMDRLVCGDVGYGKTEVALRAAFKAVNDGLQVALLVPTTILAQQHYATFVDRLSPYPIRVDVLSRFRTQKEQRRIVEDLREGAIDIVIGTHRLIQKDIRFRNLGLVVVDEEQRFGVAHKEHIKKLRRSVDFLTLSATPIPRTLYMALSGVRDMSAMDTPPEERYPVKTYVGEYSDHIIQEAVKRELDRGGQVFFLHNRIRSIHRVAADLGKLTPQARIAVAHGRMEESRLEDVMLAFSEGEFNVLVCTTIIESGLDIPNANTLVVDRADRFGLSQLYQLRGRIGRSSSRAYSYLLVPRGKRITPGAEKRLQAILEASELGSGFRIAMRDLEIRGAGNILGAEQSGHIHAIGFELYTKLLNQAVQELREQRNGEAPTQAEAKEDVRVDLPLSAHIPNGYIGHLPVRLNVYQRLMDLRSQPQIDDMREELRDRFGRMPKAVDNLLYLVSLKIMAQKMGVQSIASSETEINITLKESVGGARLVLERTLGGWASVGNRQIRLNRRVIGSKWRAVLDVTMQRLKEFQEKLSSLPVGTV